jgi:RNA polymerase sigma factor (sigma-70 family)
MSSTPVTLLERLRRRDQNSWEEFHELYGKRIWTKVLQFLGVDHHSEDWSTDGHQFAADVCQEAVLSVLQNLNGFVRQRAGSFRKWLDTIVRNAVLKELRTQSRRPAPWSQKTIDDLCSVLADENQGFHVFTKLEHDQHLAGLALNYLKEEFSDLQVQAVLRLILGDAKAPEIARELGKSVASVYMLRHHVLRKLREYMQRYYLDFSD